MKTRQAGRSDWTENRPARYRVRFLTQSFGATGCGIPPCASRISDETETLPEPNDDPGFLNCVDRLLAALIERHSPEELYLVRIANWFDHKWLRFSGIGRVRFDGGKR